MTTTVKVILAIVVLAFLWLAYKLIFAKPADGTQCDSDGDGINDGAYLDGVCVKAETVTSTGTPDTTGTQPVGTGNVGLNLAFNSIRVAKSSVSVAQNPSVAFNNMLSSTLFDFNVLSASGSNPTLINFDTKFDSQCPQYVWYKKWLYVFRTSQIIPAAQAGPGVRDDVKRCYYSVSRAELPSQIRVRIPSPGHSCPSLRLYISGVEYKYSTTNTETITGIGGGTATYCTYLKQQ